MRFSWLVLAASVCLRAQDPCADLALLPDYQTFRAPASGAGWHRVGMPDRCKWTARTDQAWIRLGNTWGWGQEPLWYGVEENAGAARAGIIEVTSETGTKRSISIRQASKTPPQDRVVTVPMTLTLSELAPSLSLRVFRSGVFQGYTTGFDGAVVSMQVASAPADPRSVELSSMISNQASPTNLKVIAEGASNSPLEVPISNRLGTRCAVRLTVSLSTIGPQGGAAILTVHSAPSCGWTIRNNARWITLSLVGTPSGNRLIPIQAGPNNTATPRAASIDIGGTAVIIEQPGLLQQQTFADVPVFDPGADSMQMLKGARVTLGCGDGRNFCPDQPVTRAQMATFLVRTVFGTEDFAVPEVPYFEDVPATHGFFRYIQKLRELGITEGCSPVRYCPEDRVTRGQMAAFLTRLKFGRNADVLPGNSFDDVPTNSAFRNAIEKMREQGITLGCTAATYCPEAAVTRRQMAAFLVRAFFAP